MDSQSHALPAFINPIIKQLRMKKLLLSLLAVAGISLAATAADPVVVDFSKAESFKGEENKVVTVNDIEFTFLTTNAYISAGYNGGANYVMLKNAAPRGAFSFALPFDCATIKVTTTSSPSTNAGNKVTLYGNDNVIIEQAINKENADFTFETGEYAKAGTVYKFEATGSKNSQMLKLTFIPVSADPSLTIDDKSIDFATPLEATQTKILVVKSANLTENISVSFDNSSFTATASSFSAEDAAAGIEISYTGNAAGTVSANATFAANGQTVVVPMSALTVSHKGTEESPLTVSDVIEMDNMNSGKFYVRGIIGNLCAANAVDGMVSEVADASKNVATNIVLKEGDKMIGVAITGDARTALNIVDNPDNAGKYATVLGSLEKYFSAPGVKGVSDTYKIEDNAGIEGVVVDGNEAVEYYNLQGVRVANPENGIYIRRQGNKATKVLVK